MKKLYDINEEDEFGTASAFDEGSSSVVQPPEQIISGLGIEDDVNIDAASEEDLNALLKTLNSGADQAMIDDVARQEAEREKYRQEEERRLREAQEKYNRERFEREQALKAERLAKEAEEEALALEEEKKKKSGLFSKLTGNKDEKLAKKEQKRQEAAAIKEAKLAAKKAKEEEKQVAQDAALQKAKQELLDKEEALAKKMAEMEAREAALLQAEQEVLESEKQSFEVPDDISAEEGIDFSGMYEAPEEDFSAPDDFTVEEHIPEEIVIDSEESVAKETEKVQTPQEDIPKEKISVKKKLGGISSLFSKKEKPVVSEEKQAVPLTADGEPDWKYIAIHDELTGILNSRAYAEDLKTMPLTFGVVFFDINNLKYVNDNYSHASGNKIIKAVANLIQKEFGSEHSYRTGGDEFVVLISKTSKNTADTIQKKAANIHSDLAKYAKDDSEGIPYAVSIGYAIGDGKRPVEEVVKAADASMYRNKKAYKDSHPEFSSHGGPKKAKAPAQPVQLEHDELLTSEQKMLKGKIKENHRIANENSTEKIVREIQKRSNEVNAVLIASPTFDHLFIIRDVDEFLDIVLEQEAIIDYSYLYVVYDGGPQYYGSDEYYTEVTHIFEPIAEGLLSGSFRSEKDIRAIKGINIFKNVFI